jgi:ribosomal protein S6--L-glutamate ligase
MKIGMLMLRYPADHESTVITGVIRLLSEWGAQVDVIYPEEQVTHLSRVRAEHDLYVLKSRTEMALGLAGILHAAGAAILNPYPVSAILRDRITTTRMLMAADVPVPETVVTARPEMLAPLLAEGPLAIKHFRGSMARGIHVVWDAEELDGVPSNQGPVYAQRFLTTMGIMRRVYAISGQIFGVRTNLYAVTYDEKVGEAFTVTPAMRDVAHRCGKAFGIEAFGLDVIEDGDDVYVVDVHSFPSFKGVPDASLRLADHIYHACRRVMKGEPMLPGIAGGVP